MPFWVVFFQKVSTSHFFFAFEVLIFRPGAQMGTELAEAPCALAGKSVWVCGLEVQRVPLPPVERFFSVVSFGRGRSPKKG